MAERAGFEPADPLVRSHLISNQAPSASRPPLRGGGREDTGGPAAEARKGGSGNLSRGCARVKRPGPASSLDETPPGRALTPGFAFTRRRMPTGLVRLWPLALGAPLTLAQSEPLPGDPFERLEPEVQQTLGALDPLAAGWKSEALADATAAQLERIGAFLARPQEAQAALEPV